MTDTTSGAQMVTALVRLRAALQGAVLPLELPGVEAHRLARTEMVDQLEDYVIPRIVTLEAPLLAVVGGSTGAGKSTLVNSLVGAVVTESGVLRPTTRSPVLVHNPADADWFGADRLLPDLERVHHATHDPQALQLVALDVVPQGLAILDAPDIDSVEESNRHLAAQLLAAADLWLFVTSAARYADQVPWDFLRQAAERSAAVAIVLDRTPPDAVGTVASPPRADAGGPRSQGLAAVHRQRGAAHRRRPAAAARGGRDPALADRARRRRRRAGRHGEADHRGRDPLAHPAGPHRRRRLPRAGRRPSSGSATAPTRRTTRSCASCSRRSADGTLLRGEVMVRWQEFVGTGELLKSLEAKVGWFRDRMVNAIKGKPQRGRAGHRRRRVEPRDPHHRARRGGCRASRGVVGEPRARPPAARRRRRGPRPRQPRPAPQGRARRPRLAAGRARDGAHRGRRQAQHRPLPGLRRERALGRPDGRRLLPAPPGLTGAEVGIAGGGAVLGQKLLEAVFGDQAVRTLAERARRSSRCGSARSRRGAGRYLDLLVSLGHRPGVGRPGAQRLARRRRPALRRQPDGRGPTPTRLVPCRRHRGLVQREKMTSLLEGAKRLVSRGSDLGDRIEGSRAGRRGRPRAPRRPRGRRRRRPRRERVATRLGLTADHTVVALAGATGLGQVVDVQRPGRRRALLGRRTPSDDVVGDRLRVGQGGRRRAAGVPRHRPAPPGHARLAARPRQGGPALQGVVLLDLPDHDSTEVVPPPRGRPADRARRPDGLGARPAEVRRRRDPRPLPRAAGHPQGRDARRAQPHRRGARSTGASR